MFRNWKYFSLSPQEIVLIRFFHRETIVDFTSRANSRLYID